MKNTIVQWAGTGLSKVIGLAFVLVITRGLGAEQYGKYSLVFTFLTFFNLLASFGVHTIAVREMARQPEQSGRILGDLMLISAALSLLAGSLCIGASYLFGYPADILLGIKVAALVMLFSPLLTPGVYFESHLMMGHVVLGNLLRDLTLLAFAVWLANTGAGFMSYIWVSTLATAATVIYLWSAGHRLVRPQFALDAGRMLGLLRTSLPLGLSGIALYAYNYIDTIMLSKMTTMAMVGYYGVAYKFVFLGQLLPKAILVSLFPLFSKYAVTDPARARRYLQYAFDTIFIAALFLATLGVLYSWDVILLLFGREFAPSFRPLTVFSVNFLFMYPNMLFSNYLVSAGRQRLVMLLMVLTATANIAVNFYVIPRYGVTGAALTTMMSEIIFFVLAGVHLVRRGGAGIDPVPAFKMLVTAGVCLLVSKACPVAWWLKSSIIIIVFIAVTQSIRAYDYRKLLLLFNRSGGEL